MENEVSVLPGALQRSSTGSIPTTASTRLINILPNIAKAKATSHANGGAAVKVYISVNIVSLFTVDTLNETFTVRMVVRLMWCAKNVPSLRNAKAKDEIKDLVSGMGDADRHWKPHWYPEFGIRNRVETQETVENFIAVCTAPHDEQEDEDWLVLADSEKLKKEDFWVIRETTMNVVINSLENLRSFPFDVQDLQIVVRMEHPTHYVLLRRIEDLPTPIRSSFPDTVNVPDATLSVNFDNLSTAERSYWPQLPVKLRISNDFVNRAHAQLCGALHVSIHVQRRLGYYLYNVFLMVGFITTLSATVWAITPTDIANRLGTNATLLLTIQAFKVSIADKLPKVNYLTRLDIYILVCFLFNFGSSLLHIRTGWHSQKLESSTIDDFMLVLWCSTWVLFNLGFLLVCYYCRRRRFRYIHAKAVAEKFELLTEQDAGVDSMLKRRQTSNNLLSSTLMGPLNKLRAGAIQAHIIPK